MKTIEEKTNKEPDLYFKYPDIEKDGEAIEKWLKFQMKVIDKQKKDVGFHPIPYHFQIKKQGR